MSWATSPPATYILILWELTTCGTMLEIITEAHLFFFFHTCHGHYWFCYFRLLVVKGGEAPTLPPRKSSLIGPIWKWAVNVYLFSCQNMFQHVTNSTDAKDWCSVFDAKYAVPRWNVNDGADSSQGPCFSGNQGPDYLIAYPRPIFQLLNSCETLSLATKPSWLGLRRAVPLQEEKEAQYLHRGFLIPSSRS